eukprot:2670490-Rhodomonas_salina.1
MTASINSSIASMKEGSDLHRRRKSPKSSPVTRGQINCEQAQLQYNVYQELAFACLLPLYAPISTGHRVAVAYHVFGQYQTSRSIR